MTERSYMQHKYGFAKDDFKIDEERSTIQRYVYLNIGKLQLFSLPQKNKLVILPKNLNQC